MSGRSPAASVARMSLSSAASRARALLRGHPWIADGLLWAVPVAWLSVNSIRGQVWVDSTSTTPQWVHIAIVLLMTAPLALRRLRPLMSSVLIAVGCVLSLLAAAGPSMAVIAVPLTVFSTAKWGSRTDSRIVLGLGLTGSVAMGIWAYMTALQGTMGPGGQPLDAPAYSAMSALIILCAAIVLSAWLLGILAHRRRTAVEDIHERNRLLEKERESESRLAADAERMRIAREMHDIIAHSLSVVIAQADGGRYAGKNNPAAAEAALTTIAATGRDALVQTRSLLGVLRTDSLTDETTAPLPGLADIPSLVDDLRAAGLAVSIDGFDTPDEAGRLSEGAGLAVYRIVQEALTNVLKHAGSGARARVALSTTDQSLVVRISDDGGPTRLHGGRTTKGSDAAGAGAVRPEDVRSGAAGSEGAGSGIIGMRERATLYGGSLEAGSRRGGESGFTVTARFPSEGRAAAGSPAAGSPAAQTTPAPSAAEVPKAPASAQPVIAGVTSGGVTNGRVTNAGVAAEDLREEPPGEESPAERPTS